MKKNLSKKLWELMFKIRLVEEQIADEYSRGNMRCPMHLSIGQELAGAAAGLALKKTDMSISTHRAHAHFLGKGGSVSGLIAELHGKITGCSKGLGGSMHLCDKEIGFMGSTAIVGNSIPVGVGIALANKIKRNERVVCIHIGEGATEEGVFYESINFAAVKSLPIVFLCENNKYSVYAPLLDRQPSGRKISKLVKSMGIESAYISGNDAEKFTLKLNARIQEVRMNKKPFFIEVNTYRWREHCGPNYDDDLEYRPSKEIKRAYRLDPLNNLTKKLLKEKVLSPRVINSHKRKIIMETQECFERARAAAWPKYEDQMKYNYAE